MNRAIPTATLLFAVLVLAVPSWAQTPRPIPYPVMPPPQFERAIEAGTRTVTGEPGPNYWQNRADYDIEAHIDTDTNLLTGRETIRYTNNSPDDLPFLVLKIRQNVHKEGVPRNRYVEITGGSTVSDFSVDGQAVEAIERGNPDPGQYRIQGTILTLALPDTLRSGDSVNLDIAWSYTIPNASGAFRNGHDGEVYYIAYWYPQLAVYDDVFGWHTDQYLGMGEHYMGFGDYTVDITVPEGFLLWGTGMLQNPDEVLSEQTRERLAHAYTTDGIVQVVTEEERMAGTSTQRHPSGELTWTFHADNVRDFAIGTSDRYVWDATHAKVDQDGDGNPETVLINSMYRPGTTSWERSAEFGRFSIEHLSDLIFPYPYPQMTAVEGLIGGGMEFPMMTLIGGARNDASLFGVTYHEISHMWFAMIVGSNEKAYTWMDEGLTSYNTNVGRGAFFDGSAENRPKAEGWRRNSQAHYFLTGTGYAVEPMRHNDLYPLGGGTRQVDPVQNGSRTIASYSTPAVMLYALEGIVGTERFLSAYQEYARRWAFKHPYPYDLMNSFEDGLGADYDWFWTPTLFETWTVDHAIGGVDSTPDGVTVTILDLGLAFMPAVVQVTYADGTTQQETVPVSVWLDGARGATLSFPSGDVAQVEIDPAESSMDADRSNNTWGDEGTMNSSN